MGRYKRHKTSRTDRMKRSFRRLNIASRNELDAFSNFTKAILNGLHSIANANEGLEVRGTMMSTDEMMKRLKEKFPALKEAVEAQ